MAGGERLRGGHRTGIDPYARSLRFLRFLLRLARFRFLARFPRLDSAGPGTFAARRKDLAL
ncbi:hypothetical protein ACIHAX_19280 [Nocardia sp. NPDC051929]|uniref:hypothetical protein n=1 Tax=Nocardia sp. NPDC051929 TaxID=3364327 RepID=UPI0037C759BF